ncbi:hypothetical protein PLAN_160143 [Planktothrix rubescens CCAP 1459/22]|uniref:Uncharacterized protein n=1 Tax=Planktothrix rubescens CCAP 1459/22 TaxID=329571 RepID=A0A6J7ZIW2_PLARU|nr:hypothetical protein PLAN_160143 [Planktothrix rubescens NIVA-CYA 18]
MRIVVETLKTRLVATVLNPILILWERNTPYSSVIIDTNNRSISLDN